MDFIYKALIFVLFVLLIVLLAHRLLNAQNVLEDSISHLLNVIHAHRNVHNVSLIQIANLVSRDSIILGLFALCVLSTVQYAPLQTLVLVVQMDII